MGGGVLCLGSEGRSVGGALLVMEAGQGMLVSAGGGGWLQKNSYWSGSGSGSVSVSVSVSLAVSLHSTRHSRSQMLAHCPHTARTGFDKDHPRFLARISR